MRLALLALCAVFPIEVTAQSPVIIESGSAETSSGFMSFSFVGPDFHATGSGLQTKPWLDRCTRDQPCQLGQPLRLREGVDSTDRGLVGVLTQGSVSTPYSIAPGGVGDGGGGIETSLEVLLPASVSSGDQFQVVAPFAMTGGLNVRAANFQRLWRGSGWAAVTFQRISYGPNLYGWIITRIHYELAPLPGARMTLRWPQEFTKVIAGPDRLYGLTKDGKVAMFDRNTLASTFGGPLEPQVPGLREATALGLYRDRILLIAGTRSDILLGSVMFVQAWEPSQIQTSGLLVPARLLWTWTADMTSQATSVAGNGTSGSCVYVAGLGTQFVNGAPTTQGLIVKLNVGNNTTLHWAQYLGTTPSQVSSLSLFSGFSNVQATGFLPKDGSMRGFLQLFAESGGTPGPRDTWPQAASVGIGVVAVSNRGVFVLGAVNGEPRPPGPPNQPVQLLKRYTFDGSPRWTQTFTDPGPTVYRRLGVGIGAGDTGIWTGANLEYASGPSRLFLRHVGYDQTVLSTRYIEEPQFVMRDLTARGTASYLVGLDRFAPTLPLSGFLMRVTAP